jgi:hypothetical protein
MADHALIDVVIGLFLGRRLLGDPEVEPGLVFPSSGA